MYAVNALTLKVTVIMVKLTILWKGSTTCSIHSLHYYYRFNCQDAFGGGTYRDAHTSRLSCLSTFYSHLTVIIGENLLLSFFKFTFKPKNLQRLISSQLTTWFCHDSQKTRMPLIWWVLLVVYALLGK